MKTLAIAASIIISVILMGKVYASCPNDDIPGCVPYYWKPIPFHCGIYIWHPDCRKPIPWICRMNPSHPGCPKVTPDINFNSFRIDPDKLNPIPISLNF